MKVRQFLPALAGLLLWSSAASARTVVFEEQPDASKKSRNIRGMVFSPDGSSLLVLGAKTELFVGPSYRSAGLLEAPQITQSERAAFSPDGKLVAVAGSNDFAVFALPSRALVGVGNMKRGGIMYPVTGISFASDGQSLVAVSAMDYAVFKVGPGLERVNEISFPGRERTLGDSADFTPDGRMMLMSRMDALLLYDISEPLSPKLRSTIAVPWIDHALRADGKQIIVRNDDGVFIMNPETNARIYSWPEGTCCFAYGGGAESPLSVIVKEDGEDGRPVRVVVDSRNGRELARISLRGGGGPGLTFSRNGRTVAGIESTGVANHDVYWTIWVEAWETLAKSGTASAAVRWNEADGSAEGIAARARREAQEKAAAEKERARAASQFRKQLKVGDESNCGLVIEVKRPIVKIQTPWGEQWLKIDKTYPAGAAECRFVNGVYQEP